MLRAVHFLEVAQHAGNDVARRGSLQIQAQRHVIVIHQPALALVGLQPLGEVFTAERLACGRVHYHLPLGQQHLHHEVARKTHPAHMQTQPLGQLHPQHRQADGNAPPRAQHRIQVAVVGVVVIVDVARKAQVGIKELVEHVQPLQRRGIAGQASADAGLHLVHIAQQLLHIQLGVLVLRDAGGGFEQRKVLVALHQASEILQGRRNGIAQGHGRFLGGGRMAVKAQNRGLYPGVTATAPRAKNAQRRSICRSLSPAAHRAPKYTTAAAAISPSNRSTRWPLWARRATQSK